MHSFHKYLELAEKIILLNMFNLLLGDHWIKSGLLFKLRKVKSLEVLLTSLNGRFAGLSSVGSVYHFMFCIVSTVSLLLITDFLVIHHIEVLQRIPDVTVHIIRSIFLHLLQC